MTATVARACLGPALIIGLLAGCESPSGPALPALETTASSLAASQRISGRLPAPASPVPAVAYGVVRAGGAPGRITEAPSGDYSLDFADTDVREVVAQILGGLLHKTYTIDPAVHGSVTLHTAEPVPGGQLLSTLQTLLANAGVVMVQNDNVYRIVLAASAGASGSVVVPLRYVSADELVKVLQPVVGANAKITAETGLNALLVSGDPAQIEAVHDLVRSFDDDALSHQSYALLPVNAGSARDFAEAMQEAFRGRAGASLSGLVRVVPLAHLNFVMIISSQPRYIDAARQVYALVERERRNTIRIWNVYYLQNSNADDIAYTLQMAFTPNNVTAQPDSQQGANGSSRTGSTGGGLGSRQSGAGGGGGAGGIGGAGGFGGGSGQSSGGTAGGGLLASGGGSSGQTGGIAQQSRSVSAAPATGAANPLLGGLDPSAAEDSSDAMRILPNQQNNAVLIYGTPQEEETVIGMLRKIDILPMQVRIDATIAEVTLNDTLQYGTQFFFKSGGINGILNNAATSVGNPATTVLGTSFPGFLLGGKGQGGAPVAISALQAVTTVNVLSSPQITVVDNKMARLQVGALVPYLTGSSQSTISLNAPVINSIAYQPTGVIMEVTPRVNSGGLITLDVSQEVSDVDTSASSSGGIASPTFNERNVTSRVVVQDGQTIGMAGLIRDSVSHGNQGIPWLKDIPILGALAGTQDNTRVRTELLILITPHVIRDQSEMRKWSEDMREVLSHAAATPLVTQTERISGSSDPNRRLRERARRSLERQTDP